MLAYNYRRSLLDRHLVICAVSYLLAVVLGGWSAFQRQDDGGHRRSQTFDCRHHKHPGRGETNGKSQDSQRERTTSMIQTARRGSVTSSVPVETDGQMKQLCLN